MMLSVTRGEVVFFWADLLELLLIVTVDENWLLPFLHNVSLCRHKRFLHLGAEIGGELDLRASVPIVLPNDVPVVVVKIVQCHWASTVVHCRLVFHLVVVVQLLLEQFGTVKLLVLGVIIEIRGSDPLFMSPESLFLLSHDTLAFCLTLLLSLDHLVRD